ncbi:BTAD domain-containing putative transcriptional regulator, partial [Nonomuraea sp. NPDC055795]
MPALGVLDLLAPRGRDVVAERLVVTPAYDDAADPRAGRDRQRDHPEQPAPAEDQVDRHPDRGQQRPDHQRAQLLHVRPHRRQIAVRHHQPERRQVVLERVHGRPVAHLVPDGRQAEALAAFADLRAQLAGELGLDPGPELTA